ncbi:hypothetical protein [Phenylobacterium zucineum]|nr:hypothetical protein [Phenylobacterium zucineum]
MDFANSLDREDLLEQVVRLEATVYPSGEGSLFGVDMALQAAWPARATPPSHEVILVRAGGELEAVQLSAFDSVGRPLLRRRYVADCSGRLRSVGRSGSGHGA